MAKRNNDTELEGPSAKMRREDTDDSGGRTGRVRKKSAKVLEMEEFEQVEKTHHLGKKGGKPPKAGNSASKASEDDSSPAPAVSVIPKVKVKALKTAVATPKSVLAASLMQTPIAVTPVATTSKNSKAGDKGQMLAKPLPKFVPVQSSGILATSEKSLENPTEMLASVIKKEIHSDPTDDLEGTAQSEKTQSVMKYLLSSPSSGSKAALSTMGDSGAELVGGGGKKSGSKKVKNVSEKSGSGKTVKAKSAKVKLALGEDGDGGEASAGLKMRISASSDPHIAQVTLNPDYIETPTLNVPVKAKKSGKKTKPASLDSPDLGSSDAKLEPEDPGSSPTTAIKKQVKKSKKKERLIQNAISAAQKLPSESDTQEKRKPLKKQKKVKISDQATFGVSTEAIHADEYGDDDAGEESNLVIAETEKKKKKTLTKKKGSLKGKDKGGQHAASKMEDEKLAKKLSKRAPTAYMLFCNTHRPGIVNLNPGIEFAGISRKLGEMWQTLSTKQKLQWRRKAQRRMKRGSNLISTGKASKDSTAQNSNQVQASNVTTQPQGAVPGQTGATNSNVRYINTTSRSLLESPQSPTKVNMSIEPVDVAAHLKLLGESLSIIGMRLQEHKGMIAVQGSLSVLLDSLLCACGPLLCLTQQVPDMDGCDPVVHAQTLDSVAYVMPGL